MAANRNKQGQFVKGQSGNPKGRPGIPAEVRELAKEAPAKIKAMIDDETTPAKVRADLLKWSFEMVYGKAAQRVDMDVNNIAPVVFSGECALV